MKAAVLTKPFKIELKDIETPVVKDDEVLIEMVFCGICGSELHAFNGKHPLRMPPAILGHEVSGVVKEIGICVKGINVGDRVTVFPLIGCGKCPDCRRGEENLCNDKTILGSKAWPGPFAQYITAPEHCVFVLPEQISYQEGALVEPLAVGLHALRCAHLAPGYRVAVLGAGAIGLGITLLAAAAGATTVIATDVQEFNLKKAKELGATHCLNAQNENLLKWTDEICNGEGCDAVFVAASAPALINQGLHMLHNHGILMIVAMYDADVPVDVMGIRAVEKMVTGTKMYLPDDFRRVIDLLATKKINAMPLVTHEIDLEDTAKAFEMYSNRVPGIVKILLHNKKD